MNLTETDEMTTFDFHPARMTEGDLGDLKEAARSIHPAHESNPDKPVSDRFADFLFDVLRVEKGRRVLQERGAHRVMSCDEEGGLVEVDVPDVPMEPRLPTMRAERWTDVELAAALGAVTHLSYTNENALLGELIDQCTLELTREAGLRLCGYDGGPRVTEGDDADAG